MIGLAFLHGWGFGPETWDDWVKAFGEAPVVVLNVGYFGSRRMDLPPNPDGWLGVGHSLGFARLLEMSAPWRGLVDHGDLVSVGRQLPGGGQAHDARSEDADVHESLCRSVKEVRPL